MSVMTAEATGVRIGSIPETFLHRVRSAGVDDLGQPVKHLIAQGGEPCRDVLRRAKPGERLILASFTPFTKSGPFKEYGPVYVLADASSEDVQRDALPAAGLDTTYLRQQFVVRAYSEAQEIRDAAFVNAADFAATVDRFLSVPETAFLHVRFPTYGCFALRIDRA